MQLTFRRMVLEYEEREKMPYITDIEELALERSMERGMERGQSMEAVWLTLSLLKRRLGELPLLALEELALEELALDLLDFRSVEELNAWLRGRV